MEYINKCITPRMKRCDSDISVKSNSSSDSDGCGGASYFRHSLSNENLQKLRDDYYKKQMSSPPTPRIRDRPDFLCSFCLSSCYHTTRDTVLTDGGIERKWDQTTFSNKNRQKYKDDGSFLKFHLRVLFCLD
jgi:hypothetical protein